MFVIPCSHPIEKLYYSAGYDPICVYCSTPVQDIVPGFYPQCPLSSRKDSQKVDYLLISFFCVLFGLHTFGSDFCIFHFDTINIF